MPPLREATANRTLSCTLGVSVAAHLLLALWLRCDVQSSAAQSVALRSSLVSVVILETDTAGRPGPVRPVARPLRRPPSHPPAPPRHTVHEFPAAPSDAAPLPANVASPDEPGQTGDDAGTTPEREGDGASAGAVARSYAAYLATLRSHILAHLLYPDQARRLAVTGQVPVQFQVNAGGAVTGARIVDPRANRLLGTAVLNSVRAAQPFPPPPPELGPTIVVQISIDFTLPE